MRDPTCRLRRPLLLDIAPGAAAGSGARSAVLALAILPPAACRAAARQRSGVAGPPVLGRAGASSHRLTGPDAAPAVRPADADAACRRSSSTSCATGDSLNTIAHRFGTTARSIAFWNRGDLSVARPGVRDVPAGPPEARLDAAPDPERCRASRTRAGPDPSDDGTGVRSGGPSRRRRIRRGSARRSETAGGDDPIEELLRPLLARRAEHLGRRRVSRIRPASRKQTRFAISRAKPISWVAISIVIPLPASSRIRLRTSATSSGSRALVISSRRSRSGCIASARTIATRCCWPPDSRSG